MKPQKRGIFSLWQWEVPRISGTTPMFKEMLKFRQCVCSSLLLRRLRRQTDRQTCTVFLVGQQLFLFRRNVVASHEESGGPRRMFIPKDPLNVGDCVPIETQKIRVLIQMCTASLFLLHQSHRYTTYKISCVSQLAAVSYMFRPLPGHHQANKE